MIEGLKPDMTKEVDEDEDAPGRTGYTGADNDKPVIKLPSFTSSNPSWPPELSQYGEPEAVLVEPDSDVQVVGRLGHTYVGGAYPAPFVHPHPPHEAASQGSSCQLHSSSPLNVDCIAQFARDTNPGLSLASSLSVEYGGIASHQDATTMPRYSVPALLVPLALVFVPVGRGSEEKHSAPLEVKVPHVSADTTVQYDYDIVYVRAGRAGDKVHKRYFADFSQPVTMEPGADLMLLRPDGTEELLVRGGYGSVMDPVVSFDGHWVYYSLLHDLRSRDPWAPPRAGADIYKIHLPTRKVVRLTNQRFSPNTGAAAWVPDFRTPVTGRSHLGYGVFNTGPCLLPGGRVMFTSNRDGFRPARGYPAVALQLFVMDDRDESIGQAEDPPNLEKVGHLNLAGALHPVVIADGRVMYSSLESQGVRSDILWGVWTIHPDGTNWNPLVSAFDPVPAPSGFHFQTQLSDGSLVVEHYYNLNNSGFGAYVKLPPGPPAGYPPFGPAYMSDPRNKPWRYGRYDNGNPRLYSKPFMPTGGVSLTPFTHGLEGPADRAVRGDKAAPAVGKFTHPAGAPDNHLLTAYSPGPVNHQYSYLPQTDSGIYLLKDGNPATEPAQLRLIKNDPNYNECWPRAVVPYRRVYGIDEPKALPRLANDGTLSPHLPEGTPLGLIGTSSFYKRESYPNGAVPAGSVTAGYAGGGDPWKGLDPFTSRGNSLSLNWNNQGADSGLYSNADVHAVRILGMEPTTDRAGADAGRRFFNHAGERLRILGEIPLRKFLNGTQPIDPDGHPDTSFLARIPADIGFTFQTLDKQGLVLNMAQTWHQLRPGEVRTNCGGCHAHSQPPTNFARTAAAKPDYELWDLATTTPLLADKARDQSRKKWDEEHESGVRYAAGPATVEYWRDVRPILRRTCVPCHTANAGAVPAGNLNLDADAEKVRDDRHGEFPGTYYRLALDERAKFGLKPVGFDSWGYPNASRYVRMFQSRRSLLAWKIHGRRLDGFSNDDHPSESKPGSLTLAHRGQVVATETHRSRADLDYSGDPMPPPASVAAGKVPRLTDENRRTLVRWIDLGCPIDHDYDPRRPDRQGRGWMLDDQRPTLTVTRPVAGANPPFMKIVIGMYDYGTGLDSDRFRVTADFPVEGMPVGENLAPRFMVASPGIWELRLARAVKDLTAGTLTVSVADRQGNVTQLARRFSVRP